MDTFYSNGKLLITGEYLVLHGAEALAIPTIPGQELIVKKSTEKGKIIWNSFYKDICWFEASIDLPGLKLSYTSDNKAADFLLKLLREANRLNPGILKDEASFMIEAKLGFRQDLGLGSSSSLINNIASWFRIDPFVLFFNTQKGSGYDIACAAIDRPIFYQLQKGNPKVEKISLQWPFVDKLAFVYSGRKQDSAKSISDFLARPVNHDTAVKRISDISREIAGSGTLQQFSSLMDVHERIMSSVLSSPSIKELRFPDFNGSIKSLGAWGGDFLMASSENGFEEIKTYFRNKGLEFIFSYKDLIL